MHRCYVPDASPAASSVRLSDEESHHVARVLRLEVGAAVRAFDGRGHEWDARLSAVSKATVTLDLVAPATPVAEPPVAVVLGAGLLKGDAMNDVIRDATMLGVAGIAPLVSAHVAVPERAWRERLTSRWSRIAVASAKQCGRAVVPEVQPVRRLHEVLAEDVGVIVCCVEPTAASHAGALAPLPDAPPTRAFLCVGPEGGWAPDDLARMVARGAVGLSLGPRTLRAESTPAVALTALWCRWGWTSARD